MVRSWSQAVVPVSVGRSLCWQHNADAVSQFSIARLQSVRAVAEEADKLGGPNAVGIVCDVTSQESVAAAFAEAEQALGPLTGLFANAGIESSGFAHEVPLPVWNSVIATNLTGVFLACQEALRSLLRTRRRGSLVLCSSPASFVGFAAGRRSLQRFEGGISSSRTQPCGRLCKVWHPGQRCRTRGNGYTL